MMVFIRKMGDNGRDGVYAGHCDSVQIHGQSVAHVASHSSMRDATVFTVYADAKIEKRGETYISIVQGDWA